MRAVVQRVKSAKVSVNEAVCGEIGHGLLVFLGVEEEDKQEDLTYICEKTLHLRVFEDDEGKLNKDVLEAGGSVLLVSQFTLLGDVRKGRRPSFIKAAKPDQAKQMYEQAQKYLSEFLPVATGIFQAEMQVSLVNDGPVTILMDSKRLF